MKKGTSGLTIGLTIVITYTLLVAGAPLAFAQPTADYVGVADNSGDKGTYVVVPVTIANVQDGPITSIIFDIYYNHSVIEVVGVQNGNLTSSWDSPTINSFTWGARVSLVYDTQTAHALQNGSTGSIVLLNFSVSGEPGETSMMNLTNIQLADNGYNVGTAPAKNGTFSISTGSEPTPTPLPTEPSVGGDGGNGGARAPHATDHVVSTPTPQPTITLPVTPLASPSVTVSPTPIPSPSQTPALRQPGFEALVAIACLVAVAYVLRRIKGPL